MTYLVSITLHRASFGLVVRDGVAAPIARRACLGRNARAVVAAYLRRGARVAVMDDPGATTYEATPAPRRSASTDVAG